MDRVLTTHVGSLIRPKPLRDLLAAKERGEAIDEAVLEREIAVAVGDVVRRQAEAGIDVIDDGEMSKHSWITYLYERVSGLEPRMVPVEGMTILPPSRDRQVLVLRYGLAEEEPKTLEEIGRRLGLTRERVRQIEVESLRRLSCLREMELAR